jgi:hypothetical protein
VDDLKLLSSNFTSSIINNTNINITKLADNNNGSKSGSDIQNSTHPILYGVNGIQNPNGGPGMNSTFFPFTNINNALGAGSFMNV